jgi:hypothetical protein
MDATQPRHWRVRVGALAVAGTIAITACTPIVPKGGHDGVTPALASAGECHYIETPKEVSRLKLAGRCPVGAAPAPASPAFVKDNCGYFRAPALYRDDFVPESYRHAYDRLVARDCA